MMGESVTTAVDTGYATIADYWERRKHYSVKQYMKLYPSYFNIQSLVIVAHSRFVSIY